MPSVDRTLYAVHGCRGRVYIQEKSCLALEKSMVLNTSQHHTSNTSPSLFKRLHNHTLSSLAQRQEAMPKPIFRNLVLCTAGPLEGQYTLEKLREWTKLRKGKFQESFDASVTHLLCTKDQFKARAGPGMSHSVPLHGVAQLKVPPQSKRRSKTAVSKY